MGTPRHLYGKSENPRYKYQVAPDTAMTVGMIMILLYGAGGEPGRGEIPMIQCSTPQPMYAIVFIRGERPVLDYKYDLMTHPNIRLGVDGGADAYTHDIPELVDVTTIEIVKLEDFKDKTMEDFPQADEYLANLVAYDDEETEAMCEYLENKQEKEKSE